MSICREGYSKFFFGLLDAKKLAANEFNSVPIAEDLLGVPTSETPDVSPVIASTFCYCMPSALSCLLSVALTKKRFQESTACLVKL